jgi:hypothetical protein
MYKRNVSRWIPRVRGWDGRNRLSRLHFLFTGFITGFITGFTLNLAFCAYKTDKRNKSLLFYKLQIFNNLWLLDFDMQSG